MKVIISIKPEYVEKIFSNEKKFEYRKSIFKKKVDSILIYATKPVGKIVGEIFFSEILKDNPNKIWELTAQYSGVEDEFFKEYFKEKSVAYAIKIDEVKKYNQPREISDYIISGKAPQSYCYVSEVESNG